MARMLARMNMPKLCPYGCCGNQDARLVSLDKRRSNRRRERQMIREALEYGTENDI